MEFLLSCLVVAYFVWLCKKDYYASGNHMAPKGYHTDFGAMNEDLRTHSRQYVNAKNARGGYDVKD